MLKDLGWLPFREQIEAALTWVQTHAEKVGTDAIAEAAVAAGLYVVIFMLSGILRRAVGRFLQVRFFESYRVLIGRTILPLVMPIAYLLSLWVCVAIARQLDFTTGLLNLAATLVTAWVVIRLGASFIADAAVSRLLTIAVWIVAALNIVGLLLPTLKLLDSVAIHAGSLRVSPLTVIEAMLWLAGAFWVANLIARLIERRVTASPALTPSMQVLIAKIANVGLIAVAGMVALGAVGIDLTALTVLTGALGLGLGFGLQKAVANFVSGLSILMDRSIKPGDVISVGETFGWVRSMGARYVSVLTRDGLEYLIPNEDLITKQVVNWSLSDNKVRIRAPIGVSYKSDIHKARQLCIDAAAETPRVLEDPKPLCHLVAFGDSSVDLELRFWIKDPRNGLVNVKSEVLLKIWDKFKAEGIEIPFPQRDVHVSSPIEVSMQPRGA
ncbi:MAG: mechanosensitive ion channel [Alphaproteobacteria bacterium]|nr:mechanosensitive ion channel [Alphaproteobacteria bacterium]